MTLPRLFMRLTGAALLCLARAAYSQSSDGSAENAIHVTTVLHEDGSKTVTQVNPEDHTSEASTYTARDRLMQKIVYSLDEQNVPQSSVVYTADNKPAFKAAYKHDDANRMSEEDDYTMAGELIRRFVYEYGSDGRLARIRAFDAAGNELQESGSRRDRQQNPPRRRH